MNDSKLANNRVVLATDLDGTLIPLDGNAANSADLKALKTFLVENEIELVFVTGRHLSSVKTAIDQFDLPQPDSIICDVGASIFQKTKSEWQPADQYQTLLRKNLGRESLTNLHCHFKNSERLRLQENEKQGDFKLSFYTDAAELDTAKALLKEELAKLSLQVNIIASRDPFNGDGLLDVLPIGTSKAFALDWWVAQKQLTQRNVIFAGDSGNDLAAMTAGYPTIIVGNADRLLVKSVRQAHDANNWTDRIYEATEPATSGVLEGLRNLI
jgi:HAD superfamily hydrolase (TIGR01484 family)